MDKDRSADGLRGIAALLVVLHHSILAFFPVSMLHIFPWVVSPSAPHGGVEKVASLPILSSMWNGTLAVSVFFVLSGYVLSRRFVLTGDASHTRSQAARRYVRLGFPILASAIFAWLVAWFGMSHIDAVSTLTGSTWLKSLDVRGVSFLDALRQGLYGAMLFADVKVNRVLWTMHIEFFGSMLLFAYLLIGEGRRSLFSVLFMITALCISPGEWPYYAGFLIGYYVAKANGPSWRFAPIASVLAGILIASSHDFSSIWSSVPWTINPALRFAVVSVLGASLIVYGVRFGALEGLFSCRAAQYLGRVSFPVYLVHLPVLCSIGCITFAAAMSIGFNRDLAGLVAFLSVLLVSLPVASLFERMVDSPVIELSRNLFPERSAPHASVASSPTVDAFEAPQA